MLFPPRHPALNNPRILRPSPSVLAVDTEIQDDRPGTQMFLIAWGALGLAIWKGAQRPQS